MEKDCSFKTSYTNMISRIDELTPSLENILISLKDMELDVKRFDHYMNLDKSPGLGRVSADYMLSSAINYMSNIYGWLFVCKSEFKYRLDNIADQDKEDIEDAESA